MMQFTNRQLPLHELPKMEEIAYEPVERIYIKALYARILFGWGVSFAAALIGALAIEELRLPLAVSTLIFAVVLVVMLLLVRKIYAFRGYALRENDICCRRGIVFHKYTAVPFRRIQHMEVTQGIIARYFGLASLNVYSAAGGQDNLVVAGITRKRAEEMKQFILEKIKDDETN